MDEIRFFMEESMVAVEPTASIREAVQKMRENNIRHLSISRGNKIVGILSIKNFANYYNFKYFQGKNQEDQIGNYMREKLETVPESTSIHKAARLMKENKIGSLLVTGNEDIAGIVTEEIFTRKVLADNLNPETTLHSELMENPKLLKLPSPWIPPSVACTKMTLGIWLLRKTIRL